MKKTMPYSQSADSREAPRESSIVSFNGITSAPETRTLATKLADQIAIGGTTKRHTVYIKKDILTHGSGATLATLQENVAKALGRHFDVRGRINIVISDDDDTPEQFKVDYFYKQAA